MRSKKPARKSAVKKKPAGRKRLKIKKKPAQRRKPRRSKKSSRRRSAQIHQGVGTVNVSQSETMPEIPDEAAEYGGES
jgi:hypothetical protein